MSRKRVAISKMSNVKGCLHFQMLEYRFRCNKKASLKSCVVEQKKNAKNKKMELSWRIVILTALGLTILWFYLMPESLLFDEESLSNWEWVVESVVRFVACLGVSIGAFVHWR